LGNGNGLTDPYEQFKYYPDFGKDGCAKDSGQTPQSAAIMKMGLRKKGFHNPETNATVSVDWRSTSSGHYVPAISHRIWSDTIPLAGFGNGNGLTDPQE